MQNVKSTIYKKNYKKTIDKCSPLWYNYIVLEREYEKQKILKKRNGEKNHEKDRVKKRN